jgi:hypothetical protein
MKTDTLIETLTADIAPERPAEAVLPWILAAATLVCGGVYLSIAGIRPDLGTALSHGKVVVKQVAPFLVALSSLGLVLRLSRPGAGTGVWPWLVALGPLAVSAAMAVELAILPAHSWSTAMMGHSSAFCLMVIPLLSAPILAASLMVLRRGAPTRPGLCGAVAGLTSATAATTAYAFFCTDDSPLFYGVWYTASILVVALAGFVLGRRILRW